MGKSVRGAEIRVVDKGSFIVVEIPDLAKFENQLGAGVLAAFCRCFVHAERLTSLGHFIFLLEGCPAQSVAVTRDYHTMAEFSLGTLREYAKDLGRLKSAYAAEGMLHLEWPEWQRLIAFQKRWDGDGTLVKLRSQVAFHVDPKNKLIPDGLKRLHGVPVALYMSDKPNVIAEPYGTWYRLGTQTLLEGLEGSKAPEDYAVVLQQVASDFSANEHLYNLVRRTLVLKGIKSWGGGARKKTRQK